MKLKSEPSTEQRGTISIGASSDYEHFEYRCDIDTQAVNITYERSSRGTTGNTARAAVVPLKLASESVP